MPWSLESWYLTPVFVSGAFRIPDSNHKWDSRFLELNSGFQSPGFQIPQEIIFRMRESEFPYVWREKIFEEFKLLLSGKGRIASFWRAVQLSHRLHSPHTKHHPGHLIPQLDGHEVKNHCRLRDHAKSGPCLFFSC